MNRCEYIHKTGMGISLLLLFTLGNLISYCQISVDYSSLNAHQKLARDIFKELIEINTT